MWDSAIITNTGKQLLADWLTGVVLNLDSAATGEGTIPDAYLMAQTDLVSRKQKLSIISVEKVECGVRLQLQCTSEGIERSYVINQIGVWASLDGGESSLVAIFQDPTGVSVPTYEEMPDYVFTFYATLQISNEGKLTATIDAAVFVTQAELQKVNEKIKVLLYYDEEGYPCWEPVDQM